MNNLKDTEAYLKKIRETIKKGEMAISQAEMRIAETDRLLEREGVTREQLLNLKFTDEQIATVNAELKRNGFQELDMRDIKAEKREISIPKTGALPSLDAAECDGSQENRKRKFGVMMQQFRM